MPVNWCRLASSDFDRIDLAAKYYDKKIFGGLTFEKLINEKRKPFIVLNATYMTLGDRFEFTQDQFDYLCSDLAGVPVARAVAASSAFPGLMSPITFKNYVDTKCGFTKPLWIKNALDRKNVHARRRALARNLWSYRSNGNRQWIHLLDGGLSDNIGLRGPIRAFTSGSGMSWSLKRRIHRREIKKIIVVTVDAKTKSHPKWDLTRKAPGLLDVLGFVATGPMDAFSIDTIQLMRESFLQREQAFETLKSCNAKLKKQCGGTLKHDLAPVSLHAAEISFNSIKDPHLRQCMEALPKVK